MINSQNTKKIFHPFIASTFPILFLFTFNIHEVPTEDITIPIGISLAITAVIWIGLRFVLGNLRSANIITLLILVFIIYGNAHVSDVSSSDEYFKILTSNKFLLPILAIPTIIGIWFFVKKDSNFQINSIFNVVTFVILLFLITNILIFFISNPIDESNEYFDEIVIKTQNVSEKPDVFLIILDEFAGKYQLKSDFNYDLENFNMSLEERGFQVPDVALSNYPNTALSMPSFLNMNYMEFLTDFDKNSKDMRIPLKLQNENSIMKIFKANGYHITSFFGGLDATGDSRLVNEKKCSFGTINSDLRKNFVLMYMPISYFNEVLLQLHQKEKLECIFSNIENYKFEKNEPNYYHMHLRLPHHPFLFDSEGNRMVKDLPDSNKDAYLGQLKFTEKKMLQMIDYIQNENPQAVIILVSDHGYRSSIDWEKPSDEDLIRGFNVLIATYFPDKNYTIDDKATLVNVFRIFFNAYFDYGFEILEEKQFWYNPTNPFIHTEITEKVNQKIEENDSEFLER